MKNWALGKAMVLRCYCATVPLCRRRGNQPTNHDEVCSRVGKALVEPLASSPHVLGPSEVYLQRFQPRTAWSKRMQVFPDLLVYRRMAEKMMFFFHQAVTTK